MCNEIRTFCYRLNLRVYTREAMSIYSTVIVHSVFNKVYYSRITSLCYSPPSDSFITCSHPLFCVYKQSPYMPVWKDMRISRWYKIMKLWIKKNLLMKGWLPTCPVACQPLSKNWRLPENMLPCIRILVRCIPLRSFPVIRQDCCLYASCLLPVVWKPIRSGFWASHWAGTVFPLTCVLCGRYSTASFLWAVPAIFPGFSMMCIRRWNPVLNVRWRKNRCACFWGLI